MPIVKLYNNKTSVTLIHPSLLDGIVEDIDYNIEGEDLKQGDILTVDDLDAEQVEVLEARKAGFYCPSLASIGVDVVANKQNSEGIVDATKLRLRIVNV